MQQTQGNDTDLWFYVLFDIVGAIISLLSGIFLGFMSYIACIGLGFVTCSGHSLFVFKLTITAFLVSFVFGIIRGILLYKKFEYNKSLVFVLMGFYFMIAHFALIFLLTAFQFPSQYFYLVPILEILFFLGWAVKLIVNGKSKTI